jgi:hypothetical protein
MSLELINKSNGAKQKMASLTELNDEDLAGIADNFDDLTIRMIKTEKLKLEDSPSKEETNFPAEMEKPVKAATATADSSCPNVDTATKKVTRLHNTRGWSI